MGRHSGFFLGLCLVSTVLAGRFATALNEMTPTEPPRDVAAEAVPGAIQPGTHGRHRTLCVPANSLIVITSLDLRGGRHTFEICAKPAGATHLSSAVAAAGASHPWASQRRRSRSQFPAIHQVQDSFVSGDDAGTEGAKSSAGPSIPHDLTPAPQRPDTAIERRFLAPRYGTASVEESMVFAKLIAADQRVAVYVDGSLPVQQQGRWFESPSPLPPAMVSELLRDVAERLGEIHDLDHDGRLAILITDLDCQDDLQSIPVLGCVRPSDFLGSKADATGTHNLTDVVYLDDCLPSGNDLSALLAHELAHAAVYCRLHDRQQHHQSPLELPEWLHEGIAHHLELLLADKTQVYEDRLAQFHRAPHRAPVCASPFVSSRSERRGGSRAAVSRFLQYAIRTDEDWRRWLADANDVNQLLGFCLEDDLEALLPEWSLREAVEISRAGSSSIPMLCVEERSSHEILGTAFKVLQSGPQAIEFEIQCPDNSPWEVRWTTGPADIRLTERQISSMTE